LISLEKVLQAVHVQHVRRLQLASSYRGLRLLYEPHAFVYLRDDSIATTWRNVTLVSSLVRFIRRVIFA
jgi:hypothetical protein